MKRVYIVFQPGWNGAFDSVWTTEKAAQDRADELDPFADKQGVRWGLVVTAPIDGDPNDYEYIESVDRRPIYEQ